MPGLDGLRAVAVVAVLLFHSGVLWVPGGFLGVEVFFVLSGYLITAGLWRQWQDAGHVDALAFWRRRARRLLPALGVLLVVVTTVGVIVFRNDIAGIKGELGAAGLYVSNWYLVLADLPYFAEIGRPSALRHLWSLAIEEQFYLVWPVVLAVLARFVRRPGRVAAATLLLAAASAATAWMLFTPGTDPSRVYYGTDTRASGLLLGAALAIVWRPFERRGSAVPTWPWLLDGAGALGLAAVVWLFLWADEFDPATYRGGLQLAAVATAVVVAAAVHPGCRLMRRILGGKLTQAVGRRSYGIYLWHWPVFVVTRPGLDVPWSAAPTLGARLAITAVLAEASYRFVEIPFRAGRVQAAVRRVVAHARASLVWRRRIVRAWSATAMPVAVAVTVVIVSLVRAGAPPPAFAAESVGTVVAPASKQPVLAGPAVTGKKPVTHTAPTVPAVPTAPPQIVAIGDSVMLGAADAVAAALPGVTVDAAVSRQFADGIAILEARRQAGALGDVVIVHLGTNGPPVPGDFERLLEVVAQVPRVVLVTASVDRRWEQPVNDLIRAAPNGRPNVTVADWNGRAPACPPGSIAGDGVHVVGPGPACYAGLLAEAARS